jgi:peptidoglycan hydrolase-like protein with peptidoglycan-binding domain
MPDEREAITLEDEDPVGQAGDEADAPDEVGRGPSDEDIEPPGDYGAGPELPEPSPRAPWRVAKSLLELRSEIDARWPNRDRRTDGTIGDERHCGGGNTSDHCPNAAHVVRAFDADVDGIPAAWLAEHVRARGAAGDARLANGGYVIYNRRIASWSHGWTWRAYTGDSPHTDHVHISVSLDASGYDRSASWGVRTATPGPAPTSHHMAHLAAHGVGSRVLRLSDPPMHGADVAFVQRWVGAVPDHGRFDARTKQRVQRYQRLVGLEPSGVVDRGTWHAMRVV